jgi:hypothetical protein
MVGVPRWAVPVTLSQMTRLVWFTLLGVIVGCSDAGDDVGSGDGGGTSVATGETGDDTGHGPGETGDDPTTGDASSSGGPDGTDDESETSAGPTFCDDLDACIPCRSCAVEADCADEHEACASDEACTELVECLEACNDDPCEDACFASNLPGQALVLALHQCLVMACPNSCG